jgi:hypothetical protein
MIRYTKDGKKVLGTHASEADAMAQERVIEMAKHRAAGGAGSGNFGHAGRPGEVGGSGESEGGGSGKSGGETEKFSVGLNYEKKEWKDLTKSEKNWVLKGKSFIAEKTAFIGAGKPGTSSIIASPKGKNAGSYRIEHSAGQKTVSFTPTLLQSNNFGGLKRIVGDTKNIGSVKTTKEAVSLIYDHSYGESNFLMESLPPYQSRKMTRDQVARICSSCAEEMEKKNITEISVEALVGSPRFLEAVREMGGATLDDGFRTSSLHTGSSSAKATHILYEGRQHLKVPVVALVEGVLHASNADDDERVLSEDMLASLDAWEGMPFTMDHPQMDGRRLSASDPEIKRLYAFGFVRNAHMSEDGKRLLMDAILDPERAALVGKKAVRLMERAEAGETVDVSVGVFVGTEDGVGEYNGKRYATTWRGIRPDHLAGLPEGVNGACSLEMGCGLPRAASNGSLGEGGESEGGDVEIKETEGVVKRVLSNLFGALKTAVGEPEQTEEDGLADEDNETEETEVLNPEEEKEMAENKEEVEQLKKDLAAKTAEIETLKAASAQPLSEEQYMKLAPESVRLAVAESQERRAKEAVELIAQIRAASDTFTEEELNKTPIEQLRKLAAHGAKIKPVPVDQSGRGVPREAAASDEIPPAPDEVAMYRAARAKKTA